MRRAVLSIPFFLAFLSLFIATPQHAISAQQTQKLSVVVTSFHEYDWVRNILGTKHDNVTLTLIIDNGVDIHSFEPSVKDISLISSADLFIYNGGVSDSWIEKVITQPTNSSLKSISVVEIIGDKIKAEVLIEGMQEGAHLHHHEHDDHHDHSAHHEEHEHDDHHDHSAHHEDHEHDDHEHTSAHIDEHVWLSLNNAIIICEKLALTISELDPQNSDIYKTNAENYITSLRTLEQKYRDELASAPRDTLIFTDRFPFLYMMDDYNINYYAAFQGCSAETEASFKTLAFLSKKVDELDIKNLIIIDNGLLDLAKAVARNSKNKDCNILELNSLQSVSATQMENGATYLNLMQENLEVLKKALSE